MERPRLQPSRAQSQARSRGDRGRAWGPGAVHARGSCGASGHRPRNRRAGARVRVRHRRAVHRDQRPQRLPARVLQRRRRRAGRGDPSTRGGDARHGATPRMVLGADGLRHAPQSHTPQPFASQPAPRPAGALRGFQPSAARASARGVGLPGGPECGRGITRGAHHRRACRGRGLRARAR